MRVVLLSSTSFGRVCLEQGIAPVPGITIAGIVTTGPRIRISYSQVPIEIRQHASFDSIAESLGCECIDLGTRVVREDYFRGFARLRPDLVIALGWYYIVPAEARRLASAGCVGIHASLLPRYRGGAPIPWAIINGERESGVTLFHLSSATDAGDIIAQQAFPIGDDEHVMAVYEKATAAAVDVLRKSLPLVAAGAAPASPQRESKATVYPQRSPADGLIDWHWQGKRIHDFVRAQSSPYPGAFTRFDGQKVTIWKSMRTNVHSGSIPGTICVDVPGIDEAFGVVCGDGEVLAIREAGTERAPSLSAAEFVERNAINGDGCFL